jgi:hypothetical protein
LQAITLPSQDAAPLPPLQSAKSQAVALVHTTRHGLAPEQCSEQLVAPVQSTLHADLPEHDRSHDVAEEQSIASQLEPPEQFRVHASAPTHEITPQLAAAEQLILQETASVQSTSHAPPGHATSHSVPAGDSSPSGGHVRVSTR